VVQILVDPPFHRDFLVGGLEHWTKCQAAGKKLFLFKSMKCAAQCRKQAAGDCDKRLGKMMMRNGDIMMNLSEMKMKTV
jgi:hypothetical protein